jgi:hypothetical protein
LVRNIVDERYGNAGKMTKEIQTDGVFGRVRKTDTSGQIVYFCFLLVVLEANVLQLFILE